MSDGPEVERFTISLLSDDNDSLNASDFGKFELVLISCYYKIVKKKIIRHVIGLPILPLNKNSIWYFYKFSILFVGVSKVVTIKILSCEVFGCIFYKIISIE